MISKAGIAWLLVLPHSGGVDADAGGVSLAAGCIASSQRSGSAEASADAAALTGDALGGLACPCKGASRSTTGMQYRPHVRAHQPRRDWFETGFLSMIATCCCPPE